MISIIWFCSERSRGALLTHSHPAFMDSHLSQWNLLSLTQRNQRREENDPARLSIMEMEIIMGIAREWSSLPQSMNQKWTTSTTTPSYPGTALNAGFVILGSDWKRWSKRPKRVCLFLNRVMLIIVFSCILAQLWNSIPTMYDPKRNPLPSRIWNFPHGETWSCSLLVKETRLKNNFTPNYTHYTGCESVIASQMVTPWDIS